MTHQDDHQGGPPEHDAFDRMLSEANQSIAPPSGLEQRVSRKIGRSIAIRRAATASGVAIVVLVAGLIIQTMTHTTQMPPGGLRAGGTEAVTPTTDDNTPNLSLVHRSAVVRNDPESKFFARAIPTSKPNVTIVRLYRDLTPTPEPTLEPETADEEIRDKNTENKDQNPDPVNQPGAAGPGVEPNETFIRSEA